MNKKLIVPAIVLLAGGAGAGGWFWTHRQPVAAAAAAPKVVQTAVLPVAPFLVNLADTDASRFLRVTLQLVVDDPAVAAEFGGAEGGEGGDAEVARVRLRSALLELLTTQTSDRLVTSEGKADLKKAIAERATGVLGHAKVVDVLFTDFVVQF